MRRTYLFFALCLLASCAGPSIPIKDHTLCSVAGIFQGGLDCATDESGKVAALSFSEMIDFLEPQPERSCVPVPGFAVCADDQRTGVKVSLPARAGAVMEPDDDFTDLKTALEQACTELKDRCTTEIKTALAKAKGARATIQAAAKEKARR